MELKMRLVQPPNTIKYEVAVSDSLAHIALQYNTTPTELSRLNHLSSSLLFPGQTLFVPWDDLNIPTTNENTAQVRTCQDGVKHALDVPKKVELSLGNIAFSPDKNLDSLLNTESLHNSSDQVSRKYLKLQSKYVTDGQGVVSGVLLVTPQTVMFNPSVSDPLVMEHELDMYLLRLPLRAISKVILFQDVAAMVVGDMSRQYTPKVSFIDYACEHLSPHSPKPGLIVCQETGKILHSKFEKRNCTVNEKGGGADNNLELTTTNQHENILFTNVGQHDDENVRDQGLGNSSENLSSDSTVKDITVTLQTSESSPVNSSKCTSCQNFSEFMDGSQQSSTPKHKKHSDADEDNVDTTVNSQALSNTFTENKIVNSETNITTSDLNEVMMVPELNSGSSDTNLYKTEEIETSNESSLSSVGVSNKVNILPEEVVLNETEKSSNVITESEKSSNVITESEKSSNIITDSMVEDHFSITPEMGSDSTIDNDNSQDNDTSGGNAKLLCFDGRDSTTCDESKDSGISEVSSASGSHHDETESKDSVRRGSHHNETESKDPIRRGSHHNETESKDSVRHHSSFMRASSLVEDVKDSVLNRSALTRAFSLNDDTKDSVRDRSAFSSGSLLGEEAREWLGKRDIRLSLDKGVEEHSTPGALNCDLKAEEIIPRPATIVEDPLMYIAIKVHKTYWCPLRAKQNQIMGIPPNRDQKRREHWFAVPRERVDQFYNFLLYWSPDVCNDKSSGASTPVSTPGSTPGGTPCLSDREKFDEKVNTHDAGATKTKKTHRSYSVTSKSSMSSLREDEISDLQVESQILTQKQVHQLTRKLPSRTVGHNWELIYSTTIHGISLSTFYRNCQTYDTPVLIAIRDENKKVFGAFISEAPKVSDGFYGTGESMLYSFVTDTKLKAYNWTGDNNFFIKGSKSSFVIGGGKGVFGLWLDEDLYHGRSHSCNTFGNETLSSCEDFICCGLEAWGFVC